MRKAKNDQRHCPLIDESCLGTKCSLFNEMLNNCEIHLMSYNLYRLGEIIKQMPEKEIA